MFGIEHSVTKEALRNLNENLISELMSSPGIRAVFLPKWSEWKQRLENSDQHVGPEIPRENLNANAHKENAQERVVDDASIQNCIGPIEKRLISCRF